MSAGPSLLVIDDHEATLRALSEILQQRFAGARLDRAASVSEGLLLIAANDYDVIITDIRMPGINGVDLLREMKTLRPESTVIAMSGDADAEARVLALGAAAFFQKPFDVEAFLNVVASALLLAPTTRSGRESVASHDGDQQIPAPFMWQGWHLLGQAKERNARLRKKLSDLMGRN